MSQTVDMKERVLAAVAEVPAPTRAEVMRARAWLLACGVVGALAVFVLKGGLRLIARPPLLVALTSVGTAAISGVGMWFLFTRGRSMLGRPRTVLIGAAVLAVLGFVAWKFGISFLFGQTERWPTRPGFRCLALGVSTGALPLCAALLSWRGTPPVTAVATGAAFGAGAGLGSTVLSDLWCPVAYLPHLLLGHVLPVAALAAVGAVLGGLILRRTRTFHLDRRAAQKDGSAGRLS